MKKNIILSFCLFLLISLNSFSLMAQSTFEGKITYEWQVIRVENEQGESYAPDEEKTSQHFYFKDGKYRSEVMGSFEMDQYYKGGDSLFTYMDFGIEQVMWQSVSQSSDEVLSFEMTRNAGVVLGKTCDLLTMQTSRGEFLYYFHSSLAVDPAEFSTHKQGFWNFSTEKTRALPLKMVGSQGGNKVVIVATEVTPMRVSEDMFTPPALPRFKSE